MTEIELIYRQLKEAIVASLNPQTAVADRNLATQFIEQLKNDSSQVSIQLQLGFKLIFLPDASQYEPFLASNFVRFGFQLIENAIKFSWNELDQAGQTEIKTHLLKLVCDNSLKDRHLKDSLSKCMVEMIIREWPQKWPDLMPVLLSEFETSVVLRQF